MPDEFTTLTYRQFRERLESFGLIEANASVEGARVFQRALMGIGQPYQAVPYRGDDGPVYPEEIEQLVYVMGVPMDKWLALDELE